MSVEIKTLDRVSNSVCAVEADFAALLSKLAALKAEIRRGQVVFPDLAHLAERPLARLAEVEDLVVTGQSHVLRSHGDLLRITERMDLGVICPKTAELLDAPRALQIA